MTGAFPRKQNNICISFTLSSFNGATAKRPLLKNATKL